MATLTGASAIITLTIPNLFNAPIQLQGFAADDVYDADQQEIVETQMGVDGKLSGGFVWVAVRQTFSLQADSDSNQLFETWAAQQKQGLDAYPANGTTNVRATGRRYTMTNGFLTSFTTLPTIKKLITPRKYTVTWEKIQASPN